MLLTLTGCFANTCGPAFYGPGPTSIAYTSPLFDNAFGYHSPSPNYHHNDNQDHHNVDHHSAGFTGHESHATAPDHSPAHAPEATAHFEPAKK